ncbi:hypothetical protein JW964_14655, partial [candidate division KSB1 bacterium]|nr:hypothetical protein [candidate division KSB1 bacterium]
MKAISVHSLTNQQILSTIIAFLLGITGGGIIVFFSKLPPIFLILFELLLLMGGIILFFKKVNLFLLATLILTLTINIDKTFCFIPGHTGGVPGFVISAWFIVLIGLYVIWFIKKFSGTAAKINFFPHLTIPFLIIFIFALFSLINAVNMQFSFFQLFQMMKVFLLFFYIANNIQTTRDYKLIYMVLIIAFVG